MSNGIILVAFILAVVLLGVWWEVKRLTSTMHDGTPLIDSEHMQTASIKVIRKAIGAGAYDNKKFYPRRPSSSAHSEGRRWRSSQVRQPRKLMRSAYNTTHPSYGWDDDSEPSSSRSSYSYSWDDGGSYDSSSSSSSSSD